MDISLDKIKSIDSVKVQKDKDQIRFEVTTNLNEKCTFIAEYDQYCEWLHKNKKKYNDIFGDFINEFFTQSNEKEGELSEIIDKYGNLFPDDDMPTNATNKAIGIELKKDTDDIVSHNIPKNYRWYSGNYGSGIITW